MAPAEDIQEKPQTQICQPHTLLLLSTSFFKQPLSQFTKLRATTSFCHIFSVKTQSNCGLNLTVLEIKEQECSADKCECSNYCQRVHDFVLFRWNQPTSFGHKSPGTWISSGVFLIVATSTTTTFVLLGPVSGASDRHIMRMAIECPNVQLYVWLHIGHSCV